ncbi:hypothetical protein NDU88_002935 [Pleurodeles waltl]|uniref:Uncharacterized protein n=1 Tax=Pleurodeles waltl TaxID=8319 RepID=A0AAV7UEP7_PLEWA|nr:hypothetical protein NDU88_002935 [Pleurodeles waltl]
MRRQHTRKCKHKVERGTRDQQTEGAHARCTGRALTGRASNSRTQHKSTHHRRPRALRQAMQDHAHAPSGSCPSASRAPYVLTTLKCAHLVSRTHMNCRRGAIRDVAGEVHSQTTEERCTHRAKREMRPRALSGWIALGLRVKGIR